MYLSVKKRKCSERSMLVQISILFWQKALPVSDSACVLVVFKPRSLICKGILFVLFFCLLSVFSTSLSLFPFFFFFPCLNRVKHLDRDHRQSRPNCLPWRDVMLGLNPSHPALPSPPLPSPPRPCLALGASLRPPRSSCLCYLLYSSATWWKETTRDSWEWV